MLYKMYQRSNNTARTHPTQSDMTLREAKSKTYFLLFHRIHKSSAFNFIIQFSFIYRFFLCHIVHNPHIIIINNEETFLQDFLVILKRMHKKILKKSFLGTTCTLLCLVCTHPQSHTGVLPVFK